MKGWYGKREQHSLASKGVKTAYEVRYSDDKINKNLKVICDDINIDCEKIIKFLKTYDISPTNMLHIAPSKKLIKYYEGDEEVEYDFTQHYDEEFDDYEEGYPYLAKRRNYDTDTPDILVASDFHNFNTDQVILSILHEHGHTINPHGNEDSVEMWAYEEYLKWYSKHIGDENYERMVW